MGDSSDFLYRIIRFEHLVDIFEKSQLFFASPRSWEDPYEYRIDHPVMDQIFAQCWCRKGVSDAMWRIYSPNNNGVRIKVRRGLLSQQISEASIASATHKIADVKYRPQTQIDRKHERFVTSQGPTLDPGDAMGQLTLKRPAFDHEFETRVLLHVPDAAAKSGVQVPVRPHDLIVTILADPRMPNAVFEAFKYFVKRRLKVTASFRKSTIYEQRQPIQTGADDDES